jgi:hypothetical protein
MKREILSARFRRWAHLLFIGMWRGQVAIDNFDAQGQLKSLITWDDTGIVKTWWRRR